MSWGFRAHQLSQGSVRGSGCSLTSVSANKQVRLIGDVAQAAIPARVVLAFVLGTLRMEKQLWLCCFVVFE